MKKRLSVTTRSNGLGHPPSWLFQGDVRRAIRQQSAEFLNLPPESIQLVVTSPPDLSETHFTHWSRLFQLYRTTMENCARCLRTDGVLSIIVTDRKWKGTIVFKHQRIETLLSELGMEPFIHKILVRNRGISLFRLGFSHILCFRRKDGPRIINGKRIPMTTEFRRDVWGPFASICGSHKTRNSFPPEVVKLLLEAFTRPGDVVLDPFCGCGTTQRVALGMGRQALGFETSRRLRTYWRSAETTRP